MADEAQAAEAAQDPGSTDNGLYDLESVDPEIRGQVEPILKAIDGNVTKKFQEAAEYRKGWAPYEELGIKDMNPEAVKQLLGFAEIASDEGKFDEWLKSVATERGILGSEDDELDLDELDLSPEKVKELVEAQVSERLSPIEQTLQDQQKAEKVAEANSEISSAFEQIKNDNPDVFGGDAEQQEKVQKAIARLGYSYTDDESLSAAEMIQKGFEDYKELVGEGEKSLFANKANQPPPAEGPGAANTSPEKITSFGDSRLKQAALAKLRSS